MKKCNISFDFLSIQHCSSNLFYGKVSQNISVFFSLNYCILHDTIIIFSFLIKLINDSLRANLKKIWSMNLWDDSLTFFCKRVFFLLNGALDTIWQVQLDRGRGTACPKHTRYLDTHCGYSSPANDHHVEQTNCPVESSQPTVAVPITFQTLFSVPGIKYWG